MSFATEQMAPRSESAKSDQACSTRLEARLSEAAIQVAVFEHIGWRGMPGTFAFHPANGGFWTKAEAGRFRVMGVVAGTPDVILIRAGRTYGLELKTEHGRLSPTQRATQAALRAAGVEVAVTHGLDDALATLERWGLLEGRRQ